MMRRIPKCKGDMRLLHKIMCVSSSSQAGAGGGGGGASSGDGRKGNAPHNEADHEREWYSAFKLFAPEKPMSVDLIRFLQTPIDLSPKTIRLWWERRKTAWEIAEQRYIPARHEILGNDLAAAHFIVHRGGAVKFVGSPGWVRKVAGAYNLPARYVPDLHVERIDAAGVPLRYEGLGNLAGLRSLLWLSLAGCRHIDDWCLDRVTAEYHASLCHLDISGCTGVTERGLSVLHRLHCLRRLVVNGVVTTKGGELTCLMLQDCNPILQIDGVSYSVQ